MEKHTDTNIIQTVKNVFEEEIGCSVTNTSADFLSLGGNSLHAAKIIQRIKKAYGVPVSFKDIFDAPTVELLSLRIQKLLSDGSSAQQKPAVPTAEKSDASFALTPIQKAYLLGRDAGEHTVSSHYYIEMECENTDVSTLNSMWNQLIKRYEALRIVIDKNSLTQRILSDVPDYVIRSYEFGDDEERFLALRSKMEKQVLDAAEWPVFDIRISSSDKFGKRLHVSFDNMILDGSSICLLLDQWTKLCRDVQLKNSDSCNGFRSYASGLDALKYSDSYKASDKYWQENMKNIAARPQLPMDNGNITGEFQRFSGTITVEKWSALKAKAKKYGVTPSNLLFTTYAEVLGRWSSDDRFSVNVTVNTRSLYDNIYDDSVGEFTDIVLVSYDSGLSRSFADKCRGVRDELVKCMNYAYVDGVEIQRRWIKENNAEIGSAFPVVFTSMLGSADKLELPGNIVYGLTQTPQVWIDLQAREYNGELQYNWDVLKGVFSDRMIRDMFSCFSNLLSTLDESSVWEKNAVSHVNIAQIYVPQENTDSSLIRDNRLFEYFLDSCNNDPDAVAVVYDGEEYSYRRLCSMAQSLAASLGDCSRVCILLEKSAAQLAAVLAAGMAGAAYIPIDTHNPIKRIQTIISSSGAEVLITARSLNKVAGALSGVRSVFIDDARPVITDINSSEKSCDDAAYIIFTSGSTGVPKGVMVSDKAAANTILDINKRYGVGPADRTIALSNLSFDLSVYDMFGMFSAGGAVVMPRDEDVKNPVSWIQLVSENKITVWNSVPTFMEMLCTHAELNDIDVSALASIRLVLLSGDRIKNDLPDRIRALIPGVKVVCLGGATEAAIWSNYFEPSDIDPRWQSIPYGYPLTNQLYYILDQHSQICPEFVEGELCIAGNGLALGYLNDSTLTGEKFIFNEYIGKKVYLTGDRGKMVNGCIWFLGRKDTQVKKRGYRIELGEIENALMNVEFVSQAKVGFRDNKIYGFISSDTYTTLDTEIIMNELSSKVPDYYLPDMICQVAEMPLNKNGKIDLKQLWKEIKDKTEKLAKTEILVTDIEKTIGKIWSKILHHKGDFLKTDDFFQCGGDSLCAVEVVSQLNNTYQDLGLEIKDLFHNSTIHKLNIEIEKRLEARTLLDEGVI